MDKLIDLNTEPGIEQDVAYDTSFDHSRDTSVLRRHSPTRVDYRNAKLFGALRGALFGLVPALVVFVWLIVGMDAGKNFELDTLIAIPVGILAVGAIISALIALMQLQTQVKNGYLAINDWNLEYWTRRGIVSLPMEKVFGATHGHNWLNTKVLSIFYHSDNKRGFDRKDYDFKRYHAVSGPARKNGIAGDDGLQHVREAIMLHYNRRKTAGLPVAKLPKFRFSAIASHKEKLLWGKTIVDGDFSCDGETVYYVTPKQNYEFPVTAVRDVKVKEVRGQHGRTQYEVVMTLDPSSGPAELKINILHMSNNEEVDRYSRALPSVFPESKLDGYWS